MKFNKPRMIRLKSRLDTTKERISKVEDPSEHMEIKRWQQVNRMADLPEEGSGKRQQGFRREQRERGGVSQCSKR